MNNKILREDIFYIYIIYIYRSDLSLTSGPPPLPSARVGVLLAFLIISPPHALLRGYFLSSPPHTRVFFLDVPLFSFYFPSTLDHFLLDILLPFLSFPWMLCISLYFTLSSPPPSAPLHGGSLGVSLLFWSFYPD